VCGAGDEVRDRHRIGVLARRDQPGVVRHVHHEIGADLARHARDALEVDAQGIRRGAGEDQLGPVLAR